METSQNIRNSSFASRPLHHDTATRVPPARTCIYLPKYPRVPDMSAVSATAFTALRVRVAASRLARSRVSGQGLGTTKSLLSSPAVRTHATLASTTAASMNVFSHPRLLSQLSRLAQSARVPVPRAAPSDDTGDASSGSTETSSDQTTDTTTDTIPVSFSADEEAFGQASGEGNCEDYDVVTDKVDLNKVNNIVADAAQATGQPGWFSKPEISKNPNEKDPSAYVGGDVGYSKFYPPEARGYKYKRRVMVAVDGSVESEAAVRWAIQHICRSGDLLHIVHCAISIDPRLATFYGPLGDQISISGDGNPYSKKKYQIANDAFVAYPDEIHKRPMYDDSWAPQHLKQIRVGWAISNTGSTPVPFETHSIASDPRLPSLPVPFLVSLTISITTTNTCRTTSSNRRNCRRSISRQRCCARKPCWTTCTRRFRKTTVRLFCYRCRVGTIS